jgi:hypothetical protein
MAQQLNPKIIADIKRVAEKLGLRVGDEFGKQQYLGNPNHHFSSYDIYDGGNSWKAYCNSAGYTTKELDPVPDEVYFKRLQKAVNELGRYPKASERKRFGLNFRVTRFHTLSLFIKHAIEHGHVKDLRPKTNQPTSPSVAVQPPLPTHTVTESRPTPAIPAKTKRRKWERTNVKGLPYAPHDELSVVALFGILCATDKLGKRKWEILEMTGGKGIDAICYDHDVKEEIRVELKHIFSKSSWNHSIDEIDYVVCWENRWKDFGKPVIELREILK